MDPVTDLEGAEARLGTVVADKYELVRVLGVGGMGAVYEAHHRYTERRVALKVLHASVANSPTAAARFLREAKTSAIVDHPAIVDVLDAGRDGDGALYLAFELLQGEDLGRAIQGGRVSPERLVRAVIDVLGALSVAHARGLVHRDIKPPNIFLARTPDGRTEAKLLDFGIAHHARTASAEGLTQVGMVLGTLFFMSPEQMAGAAIDGRSDLWALGVVLFYGLTSTVPFESRTFSGLLVELAQRGPMSLRELRPDLPSSVVEAVDRALRPKAEERWATADELARTLRGRVLTDLGARDDERSEGKARVASRTQPPRDEAWKSALAEVERETRALEAKKRGAAPEGPTGAAKRRTLRDWFSRGK
ncbi:serine/threonine protein kinase [Myxococcota bacterium]|nr:serine/threonine protein kinase [Myxococcota bacterium]